MDNATSDNKNKFVLYFLSLIIPNKIYPEVYVNFMIVDHTHDDIDALFGRWSMALKKESFLTIPLLMKLLIDAKAIPIILNLIKEVPNFKKFIADGIVRKKMLDWDPLEYNNSSSMLMQQDVK